MKAYQYVVEGRGEFPVDMLRRDRSLPVTKEDADLTANVWGSEALHGKPMRRDTYKVTLQSDMRQAPNTARWETFGFRVLEVGALLSGYVSAPRQPGRPRVHPEGTSDSQRAIHSDTMLRSAGGARRTVRLSAAALEALDVIRESGIDHTDNEIFERLIIEESSRLSLPTL